ncbi:hypothetical protein HYW55_05610 [Candidatus Gottesmanbacteria bacterium]|nr:hypothetical protein [Candidatus Gottesmanbacteria bacterium]
MRDSIQKKLRVGWFSFSCCEDSTILFTELLNEHYKEWLPRIEFCSAIVLQKKSEIKNLDVAFIEGAITSKKQEEQLLLIRKEAKKLVAIGACACVGMPSMQRNLFPEELKKEIEELIIRFQYAERVKKVSDVVPVDANVPGCPMDEKVFVSVLDTYLKEFGIVG